jgi:hypothetical protein
MAQMGTGKYTYELVRDFCKLPAGQTFGLVSRVAADNQDRIYVFQRKDPPVVVFDREGKYLGAWGRSSARRSIRPTAPTRSPNRSPWTASRCWNWASAASIPTRATLPTGSRSAPPGHSITRPR